MAAGTEILQHLRALVGALMADGVASLSPEQQSVLMKQTGLLWDGCTALTAIPIQNRTAVTKACHVSALLPL